MNNEELLQGIQDIIDGERETSASLQKKVDELEEKLRQYDWIEENPDYDSWFRHRNLKAGDYPAELPVPRLQLEYVVEDEYSAYWRYELIYRHYSDDGVLAVPMSRTGSRGAGHKHDSDIPEPHRDSLHIRHDAEQMRLPAFKVHQGRWAKLGTLDAFKRGDKETERG